MTRDLAWATFRSSVYVQLPEGRANVKMGSVAVLLQCLLFFFREPLPVPKFIFKF